MGSIPVQPTKNYNIMDKIELRGELKKIARMSDSEAWKLAQKWMENETKKHIKGSERSGTI